MRLFLVTGLILDLFSKLEGTADWDTYDKYRQLIRYQAVIDWKPCDFNTDVEYDFREAAYNVTVKMFKKISAVSNAHFVFSPYSLWLTLATIAEGTTGQAREELYNFLLLPEDDCSRKHYHQLAATLEPASEDVMLSRSSILILDSSVTLNSNWRNFAQTRSFLQTYSAPIKSDPVGAADLVRQILKLQLPAPSFEGNSIVIDTLNFEGLWTYAFSDAIIERAPFYDGSGKKVGYVDLMKIKRRVRMAYLPSINSKILELPVGFGGRYRMLFALNLGVTEVRKIIPKIMNSVFFDIIDGMKESIIPLDVAIPRFRMTTEIDMGKILEDLGVQALWNDVEGTKNISDPAALPSTFIQRTTVTLDTTGVKAPIPEVINIVPSNLKNWAQDSETGLDPIVGRDFIIDRPFLFGLFESKTYAPLFSATFSTPTYTL